MMVGFIAVFFLIYRWFMARRYGTPLFPSQSGPSRAQLRKAKRTSLNRQSSPSKTAAFKPKTTNVVSAKKKPARPKRRREDHNLTVIEGKKNKKKNRAFF